MSPQDRFLQDMARIAAEEAERPAIRVKGIEALQRLVPVALRDSGQSRIVGRFLLSLYNGSAFPFALTDLRGLDSSLWDDCLAVLRLDRRPELEVHEYIENGDDIWSQLKRAWA
ncbi:hypothetical protein Q1Z72_03825 [Pseudomonas qingdaonensis]|uniref:DUF7673 family protein n=1 Tax=Pseudomonas qingdaonensis TaxID=2056231 RepID=UPI00265D8860|nr:hypothetical protein [Pseudomonas qingdaonensis]WKL67811.1 hypothetical protein Q1Z72_03825 [Pseudomonas qingdaonensis]